MQIASAAGNNSDDSTFYAIPRNDGHSENSRAFRIIGVPVIARDALKR